jgi:hypothetical protein
VGVWKWRHDKFEYSKTTTTETDLDSHTWTSNNPNNPPDEHEHGPPVVVTDPPTYRTIDPNNILQASFSYSPPDILFGSAKFQFDAAFQSLTYFTLAPGTVIYVAGVEVYQFFADGRAADFGIGVVDGFLDAINPLDQIFAIPDFGPIYGHDGWYTGGYFTGIAGGVALQFAAGFAAAGARGFAACGSTLQKAALVYTKVDTGLSFINAAAASYNIYQGKGGADSALAAFAGFAPVLGYGTAKLFNLSTCFVAGTDVVLPVLPGEGIAGELLAGEELVNASFSDRWTTALLVAAAASVGLVARAYDRRQSSKDEQEQEQEQQTALDMLFGRSEAEWEPDSKYLPDSEHYLESRMSKVR